MFNKHGRQTPIKSGAGGMLGRGGARGLPTMLPMMGARAPFGTDFNPLWARKGPTGPSTHLDQLRAENELRARFPALSNIPNLEQLQALQEQAALMANLTKSPSDLIADRTQEQINLMAGNPLMQNTNSVLIAQLAAQMQRQMQQNINSQAPNLPQNGENPAEKSEEKSENNSRSNSPKADIIPGLPEPVNTDQGPENDAEPKAQGEIVQAESLPDAQIEEIEETDEKNSQKSGEEPIADKTSSLEASRDENAQPENIADPPEALEIVESEKPEDTSNNLDIVVEPTSPIPSISANSVKSEKQETENCCATEENSEVNPRKRKMDEPLDYSINEQLLQQRLQQRQGFFPFPLPNFQVRYFQPQQKISIARIKNFGVSA